MEGGVLMRSSRDERVAALMVAGRREATCEEGGFQPAHRQMKFTLI